MRYYKLTMADASGNPITLSSLSGANMGAGIITSLRSDGSTNPAALNIEIDITTYYGHEAGGDSRSYVRIWGLSLADVSQGFRLAGGHIKVEAGMAKGYPLADASEAGIIAEGDILQAFGNWMGTDMTLDLILGPWSGSHVEPVNISFTWHKGEWIGAAIGRVIKQNFPDRVGHISISGDRVAKQDSPATFRDFSEFTSTMHRLTSTEGTDDGVLFYDDGKQITVMESPSSPKSASGGSGGKQIKFQDLLGQVTWFAANQISAKMVMRGDLVVGQTVQFPKGLISTVTAASWPAYGGTSRVQDSLALSGSYQILQLQHWGNFRQPDAMSWNTTIWAGKQEGSADPSSIQTSTTPQETNPAVDAGVVNT